MKSLQGQSTENTFGFDVLSNEEMNTIKGGKSDSTPTTDPIDIFELD